MAATLSIILASMRGSALAEMFDNLEATLAAPADCEVLVKVDDEQPELFAHIESEKSRRRVRVRPFSSPRGEGYWGLWRSYNALCRELAPTSRHVIGLNDQCRFATRGWDARLAALPAPFVDSIFHWRLSARRGYRFRSLVECVPFGESFGVFSRRWIETTGGWAIGPAGGDTGQECVNFFLRRFHGMERGVPADFADFANQERSVCPADGLSPEQWRAKHLGALALYARILSREYCESHFARNAAALALAAGCAPDAAISHDENTRRVAAHAADGTALGEKSYALGIETWADLLFDYESVAPRQFDWKSWPPLLANQLIARRSFAQRLLDASANVPLPVAPELYGKLMGIHARNHPSDDWTMATIAPHYEGWLSRESLASETAFREKLFETALAQPVDVGRPGPILAALLHLPDHVIRAERLAEAPLPAEFSQALPDACRPRASGAMKRAGNGLRRLRAWWNAA